MTSFKPTLRLLSQASKARTPRARPTAPPSSSSPTTASTSSSTPPAAPSTISHPAIESHPKPWTRPEPPLVERARQKSVKQRNVWESYLGKPTAEPLAGRPARPPALCGWASHAADLLTCLDSAGPQDAAVLFAGSDGVCRAGPVPGRHPRAGERRGEGGARGKGGRQGAVRVVLV